MRRLLPLTILFCITFAGAALATRDEGFSDLRLHTVDGRDSLFLHMGEETDLYLHIDSHAELLTGFQIMLTLQEGILQLVPGDDDSPFQQVGEGWFAPCGGAVVLANHTHDDPGNGIPGTQLDYIIQTGQGDEPRPSCANAADALRFRVRALSEFAGRPVTVDHDNLEFRNTLYWQAESGAEWSFNLETVPYIEIAGFAFYPPLPDLQLTTFQPCDTLNLYDHLEAFFCPDSEFVISYEVLAGGNSATIDTVRVDSEAFLFIFNRLPVTPAWLEVAIQATAPDLTAAVDTLAVLCDDAPQVAEPLPLVSWAEDDVDSSLVLDDFVTDNDHAAGWLTYAVPEQSLVTLAIDPVSHRARLTPPLNWSGSDSVTFIVSDPLGLADTSFIPLEVTPVNDAPLLTEPLLFPLHPGSELVLQLPDLVYDPDHDWQEMIWTLAGAHDSISTVVDTYEGTLRFFTTAVSLIGQSFPYLLTVSDPEPLQDQDTLIVQVASAPPVLAVIPAQVLHNGTGELLYLDDYVADADHADSQLSWSAGSGDLVSVQINSVTHVATLSASPATQGWEELQFTVTDPDQNSATAAVTAVLLYNGLPQAAALPDLLLLPGEVDNHLDLDDHVWDFDHDPDQMTWAFTDPAPFQVSVDPASHLVQVTAPLTPGSLTDIAFYCFDPDSNLTGDDCRLLVIDTTGVPLIFDFPELTLSTLTTSGPWPLDDYVYDHDDPVTSLDWSWSGGNLVEAILDTVSRCVTFNSLMITGSDSLLFAVEDPDGDTAAAWWRFQVTAGAAPQLYTLPPVTLRAGSSDTLRNLSGYVYDPDSPDEYLEWEIAVIDSVAITYLPDADCLVIEPDSLFHDNTVAEVTVLDNDGNSDSGPLLVVSLENIPPTLSPGILPNPAVNEYLDLLVMVDEPLTPPLAASASSGSVTFELIQSGTEPDAYDLYLGSYLFIGTGDVVIGLTAVDLAGNVTQDTLLISSNYMQAAGDLLPGPGDEYRLRLCRDIPVATRYVIHDLTPDGTAGFDLLPLQLPGAVRITFTVPAGAPEECHYGIYRVEAGDTVWCDTYRDSESGNLHTEVNHGGRFLLLTGTREPLTTPDVWTLSHPYPNPFNPVTSFDLTLVTGEHLRATVYDVLGRRVAQLWDGYLPAGHQVLVFDSRETGNLASGVYFLRVQSEHLNQTRKMMLLK